MAKNNRGYFDVEIDLSDVMERSGVDEVFYLKDLQQRKLFLNLEIDQFSIADIAKMILQYNADDRGLPAEERKPILLYLVSNGGEVDSGFELIDVIVASKTPVYTINLGYQYSMGFLIGLAGHKRFATKNARFLMHDGSNFVYNSGSKVRDQMEFNERSESRIRDYVLSRTNITPKLYDKKLRVEWYMFADEAKELGVTNYIIGEDVDMDEII